MTCLASMVDILHCNKKSEIRRNSQLYLLICYNALWLKTIYCFDPPPPLPGSLSNKVQITIPTHEDAMKSLCFSLSYLTIESKINMFLFLRNTFISIHTGKKYTFIHDSFSPNICIRVDNVISYVQLLAAMT